MFKAGTYTENEKETKNAGVNKDVYAPNQPANQPDIAGRPLADSPTTSRAITETESLARDIKEGNLSGFVGNGTNISGETSFKGMMRIDGHISGRVTSDDGTVIVGDGGQVNADLSVAVAIIRGTVNGDITASQRIELGRTAKVNGNIHTASLSIDQGAIFEGSCRMLNGKKEEKAAKG
jgi:cytoskeletal protein CcmA (bactofilin family)